MPDAIVPPVENDRRQGRSESPNSLFGEILDWMLAPLLFLWPISIAATNHVAHAIADEPYDQALADHVVAISRLVNIKDGRVSVNLPQAVTTVIRADETDTLYFQVVGSNGSVLHGDKEIPLVQLADAAEFDKVLYRDDRVQGEQVRIAYRFLPVKVGLMPVLVQVAETRKKRDDLASRIISGVLLPQFAIIPLAVILVWVGLTRGIAPLSRLQERIRRRRPADLSPLSVNRVPEEVRPLVLAFNEMMARLESNLQAQQRFIADAAHQMRTPLTGLKMQTELALGESDPEQMRVALGLIAESTDRAAHLITQLLVLARTEASHEKVHGVEAVDLEALARAVTLQWVDRAMAKRIDLGFECTHRPQMIDGVPLLVRELLSNLVDNAVKYTSPLGRVTVRIRSTEFVVLEVEDNGIGIAPEDHDRVFERFFRVLGTDADGSGLGLPIVAEIAELHRARITLESGADGRGSLFRIVFPRRGGDFTPVDLRPD
jgi:two-component system sensor histidine kinase TctE